MKNWFSAKPYWLKGGLIAAAIVGISFLLSIITILTNFPFAFVPGPWFVPFFIFTQLLQKFFGWDNALLFHEVTEPVKLGPEPTLFTWVFTTLIIFLLYFVFGAISGWIIGRAKSKTTKS